MTVGNVLQSNDTILVGDIGSFGIFTAAAACDFKLNAAQRLSGDTIHLRDLQTAVGDIVECESLCVIGTDNHSLSAGLRIDSVTVNGILFGHDESAINMGEDNLSVGIGLINTIGRWLAASGVHIGSVSVSNFERNTFQGLTSNRIFFIDDKITLRLISELQSDRLACSDACSLRRIVQNVGIIPGTGLLHDQGRAGINSLDQNSAGAVSDELAIGISDYSAVRCGHEKLNIGQRLTVHAVDLFDKQCALGRVAKVQLHHILILSADVSSLRRRVNDMFAVAGQLFHDIGAFIQTSDREAAVGGGSVGADDRSTGTGGADQILYLKYGAADRFTGDRIKFVDNQRTERRILKGYRLAFAGLDKHFLRGRVFDPVTLHGLQFRDLIPAVLQIRDFELTIGVGVEIAQIIQFSALGIIAGIHDLELCSLQRFASYAADLADSQTGLLMVFKVHGMVAVGIQGNQLAGGIQKIRGRNGFLRNLIDAGKKILQFSPPICSGADLIHTMAVSSTDDEYRV